MPDGFPASILGMPLIYTFQNNSGERRNVHNCYKVYSDLHCQRKPSFHLSMSLIGRVVTA